MKQVFYQDKINELKKNAARLRGIINLYTMLRLIAFVATAGFFIASFTCTHYYCLLTAFVSLSMFLIILKADLKKKKQLKKILLLEQICNNELAYLNYDFKNFYNGNVYVNPAHNFSSDLDIFGQESLFQMLSRANTSMGRDALARMLMLKEIPSEDQIRNTQDAVRELSNMTDFRHGLASETFMLENENEYLSKFNEWRSLSFGKNSPGRIKMFISLYVAGWLTFLLLHLSGITPLFPLWLILLGGMSINLAFLQKINRYHRVISRCSEALSACHEAFKHIEDQKFSSSYLNNLRNTSGNNISRSIKKISLYMSYLDYRLNIIAGFTLNIFFLWDLMTIARLETFKKKNNESFDQWFGIIGSFEALSSFGNLHFNFPDTIFPENSLKNQELIQCIQTGHPLIKPENRICNDFSGSNNSIAFITGSNMSGKSTFLRTIGVNLVLAMSGSAVFAEKFCFRPVILYSSMRIFDSVQENLSTFYSELLRIKGLIDLIGQHHQHKVFFILDEILKGTNSNDRFLGSRSLILHLLEKQCPGLIASHDLALSDTGQQHPETFINYHFDSETKGDELFFNYKINEGVCSNTNAYLLMKKMGIIRGK